jgi:hypothetical protein
MKMLGAVLVGLVLAGVALGQGSEVRAGDPDSFACRVAVWAAGETAGRFGTVAPPSPYYTNPETGKHYSLLFDWNWRTDGAFRINVSDIVLALQNVVVWCGEEVNPFPNG